MLPALPLYSSPFHPIGFSLLIFMPLPNSAGLSASHVHFTGLAFAPCFVFTLHLSAHTRLVPCSKHMDLPTVKIFSCSTGSIPIKYQIGPVFAPLPWLLCSCTAACGPAFLLSLLPPHQHHPTAILLLYHASVNLCLNHCFAVMAPNHDQCCISLWPNVLLVKET